MWRSSFEALEWMRWPWRADSMPGGLASRSSLSARKRLPEGRQGGRSFYRSDITKEERRDEP